MRYGSISCFYYVALQIVRLVPKSMQYVFVYINRLTLLLLYVYVNKTYHVLNRRKMSQKSEFMQFINKKCIETILNIIIT